MSAQLDNASARQRRASDPRTSAWVSANAGSGKTHVLALRVIRLLLDGAAPAKILCLTFTKAAAANMADRVFNRLAKWTQLDDDHLKADILETGAPAADLSQARKLFARVLETPGGLKIQTIHAFCERVLHMFPFEANVPAAFRALDERDAALLREASQARVFAGAERDAALSEALERVAAAVGAEGFAPLIAQTARLADDLAAHGPPDAYAQKLAARLGLAPGEDEAAVWAEMAAGGGGPPVWKVWAKALATGTTNDKKLADLLNAAAVMPDDDIRLGVYLSAFLTEKQTPRKTLATKGTTERFPDIVDALYAERDRLFALLDKRRAAAAVARSRDLYLIALACETAYKRAKARRSALDFDDLIAKTQNLFERADAAWVLYKLDRGVEHILVDEAQDTSRAQWSILAKLAEDFLAGAGAVASGRTFFAVGDEKQSIFSFQGAEPHLFDEQRRFFATAHARAQLPFLEQPLIHSFRSAPVVLDAVDKVFGVAQVWRGVSASDASAPPHAAIREALPGLVEIWPTIALEPPPEPGEWRLPLDAQKATHPAQVLAERVAEQIARWTAPGSPERIVDPGTDVARPIRPGDVLILVRARAALFEALTRALRRRRVPAAGADRLTLATHIAVLDLCAAARASLNPDDDLALAAVLKSPLIGLDDEALLRLSPARPGALSAALAADPAYSVAARKIARWRGRAAASPFDFFARLLGAEGGRRALVGRLGGEAGDVIDEFLARALAHERSEAPSLTRFLDEIEAADSQIKRDMEAGVDQVRVMTVHAAKGLEAPIVILPDTGGAPTGRHDPKWLRLAGTPALPVWAGTAGEDCEAMALARGVVREGAAGEHRRLLYVAMTRAAQRLVVAGFRGPRELPADNWGELIALGLASHASAAPSWWDPAETILRLGQGAVGSGAGASPPPSAPTPAPLWASVAALKETAYAPKAPARRVAGDVGPERLARLEEGRLAHKLMQNLPALAPQGRRCGGARLYGARRCASFRGAARKSRAEPAGAAGGAGAGAAFRPGIARGSPVRGVAGARRGRKRAGGGTHRPARRRGGRGMDRRFQDGQTQSAPRISASACDIPGGCGGDVSASQDSRLSVMDRSRELRRIVARVIGRRLSGLDAGRGAGVSAILASHLADTLFAMLNKGNRGDFPRKIAAGATLSQASGVLIAAIWAASAPMAFAEPMIKYDRPVFHNGHRVLYHGAWRSHGNGRPAVRAGAKDDDEADDTPDAKPNKAGLSSAHEFIVLVDPDDATSLRMATELVNSAKAAGLKAHAWAGKTSPEALAQVAASDGGDFAVAPLDVLASDPKYADLRTKSPLVARLAPEPIAIIAAAGVADVAALQGRPVAFGEAGGVADATGQALFAKLGVTANVFHMGVSAALAALAAGKIDAMVALGADESRAVNDAARAGKLHVLAVPWRDEFAAYAPDRFTDKDLPKLVPTDAAVETVSAPFGLIAIDAADGSPRAAQSAPFVAALFDRHQPLLGAAADPKWREVNLSAETDWPRLASARDWLDKHRAAPDPALDAFRETAKTAATDASARASEVADKLYADLLKAKAAGP